MKYLKLFESFSDIKEDIEDMLLELKDLGLNVNMYHSPSKKFDYVGGRIMIKSNSEEGTELTDEIENSIIRIIDYFNNNNHYASISGKIKFRVQNNIRKARNMDFAKVNLYKNNPKFGDPYLMCSSKIRIAEFKVIEIEFFETTGVL